MRKILYKIYWKIEDCIAPGLRNQHLYEDILKSYVHPAFIWLDIGCGRKLLPPWRSNEEKKLINNCKTVVGCDYDLGSLKKHETIHCKVRGGISSLPFKNYSFDFITANVVVEHLHNPEVQFKEIHRTLKHGGLFIFHTPNAFGYLTIIGRLIPNVLKRMLIYIFEGRKEEDVFPAYYRVNSELKIKNLARLTGFNILEIRMFVDSAKFVIFPPIVIIELLWLRMLLTKPLMRFRTNIIAVLQKI